MISVGIFNGYFPYNMEESIKRIKAQGFTSIQLDLSFKGMDLSFDSLNREKCHLIRDAFRDANLPIVAVSGYKNIVHPNLVKREENLNNLKTLLKFARDLGTPYVISETGTFNEESDWVYHEKNGTDEAYETLCEIVTDLTKFAYDNGSVFLVENYVNNIVGTVNQLLRLFSDINHHSLGLLMDPTNYFSDININDVDGELNRIFNALGDRIRIAHAKDCKRAENLAEKHADIDATAEFVLSLSKKSTDAALAEKGKEVPTAQRHHRDAQIAEDNRQDRRQDTAERRGQVGEGQRKQRGNHQPSNQANAACQNLRCR